MRVKKVAAVAVSGAVALALGSATVVAAGDAFERSARGSFAQARPIQQSGTVQLPDASGSECRPIAVAGTMPLRDLLEAAFGHEVVVVGEPGALVRTPTAGQVTIGTDGSSAPKGPATMLPIRASALAPGQPRVACSPVGSP